MSSAVLYSPLSADLLRPTEAERAARLRVPQGYRDEAIDAVERELTAVLRPAMAYRRVSILWREDGALDFGGFFKTESEALKKSLCGCEEAFLLAVTLGLPSEQYLHRLSLLSPAKHFLADALGSAYAEAAIELANQILLREERLTKRFSPGYADLPLNLQPDLLSALEANKYLHITLKDSFLMLPQKSITALIGIRRKEGDTL